MLSKEQIKSLKRDATALSAFTSIGKNGLSENSITQVKNYLKVHHLCKVKILRTFLDESGLGKKEVARELAERTGAELIQLVGLMVVLYKK